jgi:hypothetical protein
VASRLSSQSQQVAADAVLDRTDDGTGPGRLRIYSGTQPGSANDAPTGTLLVDIELQSPAWGGADTSGVASLNGPVSGTGEAAAGAGTDAGWFRITDGDGDTVADGAVSGTGGGGELVLDNVTIAAGQTVTINTLTYTQPASA